jgi:hypothetical protein
MTFWNAKSTKKNPKELKLDYQNDVVDNNIKTKNAPILFFYKHKRKGFILNQI